MRRREIISDPFILTKNRAERFNVTLHFLLQQAAWLFEQQLSQVKEQLRKASRPTSIGTSPTPGSVSGSGIKGGYEMTRGISGGKFNSIVFLLPD